MRILQADARVALERLIMEKAVNRVYALFPCPWPKKRHAKHRLFSNPFLRLLSSRLAGGGEVRIVTDDQPYFRWILSQVPGTGLDAQGKKVPPGFRTKYERKWQARGLERFNELRLIKREHIPVPLKEGLVLITRFAKDFDPERFSLRNHRGEINVEFKEALYDPKQEKAMVRVLVAEEGLVQNFWIEIVKKEKEWRIRPAKGCGLLPTAGAQRALDLVFQAVGGRLPDCDRDRALAL